MVKWLLIGGLSALTALASSALETVPPLPPSAHLEYFGFALIDVGWDDPHDAVAQTNYLAEVASFTNLADLLVVQPEANLEDALERFAKYRVGAILHIAELFFEASGTGAASGHRYRLRKDFRQRWATFLKTHSSFRGASPLRALYLGEEPTWNGITFGDLEAAANEIKATLPNVPIVIVEAAPALGALRVPEAVDWVGVDHYFLRDPLNDEAYQSELAVLKTKRTRPDQRLVVILDSHWDPRVHGARGLSETDMAKVAVSTYQLAVRDPDVVALIGYTWPGGFGGRSIKGARNLPAEVVTVYREIGGRLLRARTSSTN